MEALIRELKEQAKDHIKLGDDYNVAFGRGMGKALYAIAKELEKLDKKEKRKDECEPLSLISKIILTNALKDSEKRAKKIHKKTLNNKDKELEQIMKLMSWSKILELSILEHMLESGEEFKLDKMLDALKS